MLTDIANFISAEMQKLDEACRFEPMVAKGKIMAYTSLSLHIAELAHEQDSTFDREAYVASCVGKREIHIDAGQILKIEDC